MVGRDTPSGETVDTEIGATEIGATEMAGNFTDKLEDSCRGVTSEKDNDTICPEPAVWLV